MASGKTSKYYKKNPAARKRRLKQQSRYNKTKKGLKIRTAANKCNRKMKKAKSIGIEDVESESNSWNIDMTPA